MIRNSACRQLIHVSRTHPVLPLSTSIFSRPSTSKQGIHTSATVHETARKQAARLKKRDQRDKRFEKERLAKQNKAHPALGYSPGNEHVWINSKLYNIVITREDLDKLPIPSMNLAMEKETSPKKDQGLEEEEGEVTKAEEYTGKMVPKLIEGRPVADSRQLPQILNFGVGEQEKRLLFEELPDLRIAGREFKHEARKHHSDDELWSSGLLPSSSPSMDKLSPEAREKNEKQYENSLSYWVGRVLDLKNSNAAGLAFENKRRIIAAFGGEDLKDTGRIEVQAAILTHRIHNLWTHLQQFKRDIHNRRRILELIHARAKLLKYLRRTARARYEAVLPELGLERGAIEEEIIMTREMYMTNRATL